MIALIYINLGYFSSGSYRYGFNGMEKDDDLAGGKKGMSYDFGARLYNPGLGRWLAVDPLATKYPNLSPYNFVANNPTMFIDPDGKVIKLAGNYSFIKKTFNDLQALTNDDLSIKRVDGEYIISISESNTVNCDKDLKSGANLVKNLIKTDVTVKITTGESNTADADNESDAIGGKGTGTHITYNSNSEVGNIDVKGNKKRDAKIGLGHELAHAELNALGEKDLTKTNVNNPDSKKVGGSKLHKSELLTRKKENEIRKEQNHEEIPLIGDNSEHPLNEESYEVLSE